MNRAAYCDTADVKSFRVWAAPLVAGARPLQHQWHSPKWKDWSCETLPDAYVRFRWPFSLLTPSSDQGRKGETFGDNAGELAHLARALRCSADEGEPKAFCRAAAAVLRWGGVQGNLRRLRALGDSALPSITAAARQLDPATADLDRLDRVVDMNSGFSKIYSLLLDGFPIYDSRVACAMASLVNLYDMESGLQQTPVPLAFGIPAHHVGHSRYVPGFPRLWAGDPKRYANANLRAAWLLGALVDDTPFAGLAREHRLLALQSALFMIGYQPLAPAALG